MTTLVAWVSYKNKKPTTLTFASDSRLSWGKNGPKWDYGRKIYWCKSSPDLFGYSGDMVTQSTIISHVCDLLDYSAIKASNATGEEKHQMFVALIQTAVAAQAGLKIGKLSTLHGQRMTEGDGPAFRLWRTEYDPQTNCWCDEELRFECNDDIKNEHDAPGDAFASGTGANKFWNNWREKQKSQGKNSPVVFRSLMATIEGKEDPYTGGHPQIVRLGLTGNASPVGFWSASERVVCGMPLGELGAAGQIEWTDREFNFSRPDADEIKSGARRQIDWKSKR